MIELLKRYSVAICFLILISINIGWYIIKDNGQEELMVNLNSQNNEIEAWQQETRPLATIPEEQLEVPSKVSEAQPIVVPKITVHEKVPVYICGEVVNPGVYYVESTAIVNDLLIISGGVTAKADESSLNLASTIEANQKIYVPKIGEKIDKYANSYENEESAVLERTKSTASQISKKETTQLVNINAATEEELQTLSGVGKVKAKAIIEYRMSVGSFKSIDELLNVSGIGDKTLEKIRASITV